MLQVSMGGLRCVFALCRVGDHVSIYIVDVAAATRCCRRSIALSDRRQQCPAHLPPGTHAKSPSDYSAQRFYRQDAAKRQTAGIKFTHRPKISIFAPQGRLIAPIHVKLGIAAWPCKISRKSVPGVGTRPPNCKNFHFLVKSRPAGAKPLTDFCNVGVVYTTNHSALVFYI